MKIDALDNVVLTMANSGARCDFYQRLLGTDLIHLGEGQRALVFGK